MTDSDSMQQLESFASNTTGNAPTRRSFVKNAVASIFFGSRIDALKGTRASGSNVQNSPLGQLPSLDGEFIVDDASRNAVAQDYGHHVHHSPIAVLRPKSVTDILKIVSYANKHGIKIVMRGQGHSLYGQAQAVNGIVIDSTPLNNVRWSGNDTLDVQPGALWGQVAKAALTRGLTPPVMPDALMLSVGGTLSIGGTGETSYRTGAQVDHVIEIDVVTGVGQLVTCSRERNEELFRMTLAGLGQCGIIVCARLRLVSAPEYVEMHSLTYDDPGVFLSDQARLAAVDALGPLGGAVMRESDGRWRFLLFAGDFFTQEKRDDRAPSWLAVLRYKSASAPARTPYWDYLDRRTASINASIANGRPNPSLALMLPETAVSPFLTHILSTPDASLGIWRIEVFPMITSRFTQPLHRMPAGELAFTLRLQRRASAENASDHKAMLEANRTLIQRLHKAGGKVYPPYAPILSRDEWREHYGPETWRRFAAAKKRFDPANILTPGAGIF